MNKNNLERGGGLLAKNLGKISFLYQNVGFYLSIDLYCYAEFN